MKFIAPLILMLSLSSLCMSTVTEDGIDVEFQVVTVDKKPIEGADVELIWPYKPYKNPDGVKSSKKHCLETVTDEKGWFRFENGNLYGLILVRKEGFSIGWKDVAPTNKDPIVLSPLSPFSGKVVDLQGRPVPDAHVNLLYLFLKTHDYGKFYGGKILRASDILNFMSTQTDDYGRFLFDIFPEGVTIELSISKEGYADYYTYQLSEEIFHSHYTFSHPLTGKPIGDLAYRKRVGPEYTIGMTDVIFTLKPPGTIQGVVKDSKSEKPLPGILLSLTLNAGEVPAVPARYRPQIPCITDTKGKFVFRNLEKGSYILSFDEIGHAYARNKMDIEISEGQNRNGLVFALTQGGTLNLELLDSVSQKGISNCTVFIEALYTINDFVFHTDGVFHTNGEGKLVQHFSPGPYRILVFKKINGYGLVHREHVFSIKDGQTTSMSLELQENPKTTVVVKDPDGNPVRNFKIRFIRYKRGDSPRKETWQKDDRSGFTVWVQSPTDENEVIVKVWDYRNNLVGIMPLSIPGEEVSLTLRQGLKVVGSVQDQDQNPLPNLNLDINCQYQKEGISFPFEISSPMPVTWRTDPKGQFTLSGIPPLEWIDNINLTIMPEGYSYSLIRIDPNQAANNIITLPVITLTQKNQPIQVKAVDQAGNPVKDASIMTVSGSDTTVLGKTNSRGQFSFRLSKWPVVIFAIKKLKNDKELSGVVQVTDNLHDVTITMK